MKNINSKFNQTIVRTVSGLALIGCCFVGASYAAAKPNRDLEHDTKVAVKDSAKATGHAVAVSGRATGHYVARVGRAIF